MNLLKRMLCNVEIPKLKKIKSMAKLKQFKTQVVEMWFIFNFECRYARNIKRDATLID